MDDGDFFIIIANDCIREKVFAEIYYKDEEWAEISQEKDEPVLTIFPPIGTKYWEFPLKEALDVIEKAKAKLLN